MPKTPLHITAGKHLGQPNVLFGLAVVLFVLSCLLAIYATAVTNDNHPHRRNGTPHTMTPIAVGQIISQGAVQLKVDHVTTSDGSGSFTAPSDKHYVILELSVTNNSDSPIHILPTSDTYLKTSDGNVSYVTPFALDQPFRAGELLPGETIKGQLSYQAERQKPQTLYVDAIWSGGVIPLSLGGISQ